MFLLIATLFVAFTNTIREWVDAIRMSADSLIVFSNAIRIFADGVGGACSSPPEAFKHFNCLDVKKYKYFCFILLIRSRC